MNRLFCFYVLLLTAGVLGVCSLVEAADTSASSAATGSAAVDAAELKALLATVQPVWTFSSNLQLGAGYKDNLLLSHTDPASSAFTRAGFEAMWWHIPRGKIDYFAFLNGEYTRYTHRNTDQFLHIVDHEAQAFGGLEWRIRWPDRVTLSVDGQGYYLDQVFDVSDPSVSRSIAVLKVKGAKAIPTLRLYLFRSLWMEGSLIYDRQRFDNGLNDANIREATGRVGWSPTDRFELTLAGTERRRGFTQRTRVAPGRTLTGLLLVHEREGEARADITWGASRHWKTRSRAGVRHYLDNALGYLNFHDRYAGQDLDWECGAWLVRVEAQRRRREYENQYAEGGSSPPRIVKNESIGLLRVERTLTPHWAVFAEFNTEVSRSNDEIASYRMKEGLLGARWSWDK